MFIGRIEIKRRVWVGLVFALTVIAAWWARTVSRPPAAPVATAPRQPFVRLAGTGIGKDDEVLRERAELFDPTPLFFPTEWNFGQNPLRESVRRQPGEVFGGFDAKLTFSEENLQPFGAEATGTPEKLADVLAQGNEVPFAGMGQIDGNRTALPERSSFLQVYRLSNGQVVIAQLLIGTKFPQTDFIPLEFLVAVSSAGIIGEPILTSGSGRDEVDSFFRSYLGKTFRLGERLTPGRYRVLVGP